MTTSREPKNITLFVDGTWQKANQEHPTNIALLHQCLAGRDAERRQQLGYYFDGIGNVGNIFKRAVSGMTGAGIKDIAKKAYKTLASTYSPGDKINLIGFSRGATISRILAGMIHSAGLIDPTGLSDKELDALVDDAFNLYKDPDIKPRDPRSIKFRRENSYVLKGPESLTAARVNTLTCFDSVGSLGIPDALPLSKRFNKRYGFYDQYISPAVDKAVQFMSLDEMRGAFPIAHMDVAPDNHKTEITNILLPGDHCSIGGGHAPRKGLSDYTAMRAIEMLKADIHFDPTKTHEAFQPNIFSNMLSSQQFLESNNALWYYKALNEIIPPAARTVPTCDIRHRECTIIDPSVKARFNASGRVLLPAPLEGLRAEFLKESLEPANTNTPPIIDVQVPVYDARSRMGGDTRHHAGPTIPA